MDSIRLGPTRDSLLHFIARHPDSIHLLKWLLAQAPDADGQVAALNARLQTGTRIYT